MNRGQSFSPFKEWLPLRARGRTRSHPAPGLRKARGSALPVPQR